MTTLKNTLAIALTILGLVATACGDDDGTTDPTLAQAAIECGTVMCGSGQVCADPATGTCTTSTTSPSTRPSNPSVGISDAQVCQLLEMCLPDVEFECPAATRHFDQTCRECLVASECRAVEAGDCDWPCFGPDEISDDDVCTALRRCDYEITFAQCEATIPGFDHSCRTCLMAESCASVDAGACDALCLTEEGWISDAEVCTQLEMCTPGLTDEDCASVVPDMNQDCRACVLQQTCGATDDGACAAKCGF